MLIVKVTFGIFSKMQKGNESQTEDDENGRIYSLLQSESYSFGIFKKELLGLKSKDTINEIIGGETILHCVCRSIYISCDLLMLLHDNGSLFDIKDDNGRIPLHHLCKNSHINKNLILTYISCSDSKLIDIMDDNQDTPFYLLCSNKNIDMETFEVALNYHKNIINFKVNSLFYILENPNVNTSFLSLLYKKGYNFNCYFNLNMETPLHIALQNPYVGIDVIKFIAHFKQ